MNEQAKDAIEAAPKLGWRWLALFFFWAVVVGFAYSIDALLMRARP